MMFKVKKRLCQNSLYLTENGTIIPEMQGTKNISKEIGVR